MPTNDTLSDLSAQLAALWDAAASSVANAPSLPPARRAAPFAEGSPDNPQRDDRPLGAKLGPLPPLMRCALNHRDPANWKYGPDRYGRDGVQRIACKNCDRFYGYTRPPTKRIRRLR